MLKGGVLFSYIGALFARLGVTRFLLMLLRRGQTLFPRLFVRSLGSGVSGVAGRIVGEVRKLPPEIHPIVQAHWCRPRSYKSMASHVWNLPVSSAEVAASGKLGDVPLIVISGGHLTGEQRRKQEEVAALSTRGQHWVARNSAHWIHLDEPELVVRAVETVLEELRALSAHRHAGNSPSHPAR
jgi:pimeloyl-ACP methyl ester carboxylesterase